MTPEQEILLRDKLAVWRNAADHGPLDFRDYNRRAVAALEAVLDDIERSDSELCRLRAQTEAARTAIEAARGFGEEAAEAKFKGTMSIPAREFRALAQSLAAYDEAAGKG